MAVSLPNGFTIALATAYGAAKTVTAVTNANPGVATTSIAHGVTTGAFVEVTSGWQKLNSRIVRLAAAAGSAASYEGIDTSAVANYPIGTGIGSFLHRLCGVQSLHALYAVRLSTYRALPCNLVQRAKHHAQPLF